jgi:superfamily II DNA/RNA helicase
LKEIPYKSALIFCSRKQTVRQLTRTMKQAGFRVEEMHSDLEQAQRENVITGFTSGRIPIMIATDILSRGIDIDTIDLVINYDVPRDGEDYVHRIGRTARAEADGIALTLVGEKEQNSFAAIEALIGKEVEKAVIPAELGPAPSYNPRRRTAGGNRTGNSKRKFYHGRPRKR